MPTDFSDLQVQALGIVKTDLLQVALKPSHHDSDGGWTSPGGTDAECDGELKRDRLGRGNFLKVIFFLILTFSVRVKPGFVEAHTYIYSGYVWGVSGLY